MFSIFIRTIIIYVILNIMLKIMGKRQIGELEVNELVSTLLISEVASATITDRDIPLAYAIIPVLFICGCEITIAFIKNKVPAIRRAIEGKSVYIIYKGKLRQNALAQNRISLNEILTEMRIQGIGDISDIEYGMLEQNGKVSLLRSKEKVAHTLITDGEFETDNLKELGLTESEIMKFLKKSKVDFSDVFLLTVDDDGRTNIVKRDVK